MTKLAWGESGTRKFQAGLDRGVLYPNSGAGVVWNGLTSVQRTAEGQSRNPHYIDGIKFAEVDDFSSLSGTISAFTYPDEFEACQGTSLTANGLAIGFQDFLPFHLSYRTLIGNDIDSIDSGYSLHFIYNARVDLSKQSNSTITNNVEAEDLSWSFTTIPLTLEGYYPTSYIRLDTTKSKSDSIKAIEDILYGTSNTSPRMPYPEEVIESLASMAGYKIEVASYSGINPLKPEGNSDDLVGNTDTGLFTASSDTRLKSTTVTGIYRIG